MRQRASSTKRTRTRKTPTWAAFAIVFAMTGMLFLTINYKAFTNMRSESSEFEQLSTSIQGVTDENLRLQDEIHSLKTDLPTVEREAKRLGIRLRQPDPAPVSVPKK